MAEECDECHGISFGMSDTCSNLVYSNMVEQILLDLYGRSLSLALMPVAFLDQGLTANSEDC